LKRQASSTIRKQFGNETQTCESEQGLAKIDLKNVKFTPKVC